MNVKRITRILKLLQALQSGTRLNADALADACGVSRRTVFRDIESLREAGLPVEFDNGDHRYRIDAQHFLPPTNLTLVEALSLVVLASRAEASGMPPLLATACDAAAKIEAALPPSMQEQLRELTETVTLRPESINPLCDKHEIYHNLVEASSRKRVVNINYDCLTEYDQFQTDLSIYHLIYHQRSWYAIGHSSRHGEIRTFNVGRILSVELGEEQYQVPRSFSIKNHLRNAWGLIAEPGPDVKVHLRFSPFVARNVEEVIWHPTQTCEINEDGSLDYHATVSGLREIVWWVLGYGDQVEVIAPAKLRKVVSQRLQNAAKQYESE